MPSSVPDIRPAHAFSTAALAEAITAAFAGYFVAQTFTSETFDGRFRREHLDLAASRVAVEDGQPVAVVFVARRGWTARVAAMGVVPACRGRGLGHRLLQEIMSDLRDRGDRRLVLEVIETNEPAVRLYTSLGFRVQRRLVGYRRAPSSSSGAHDTKETSPLDERDPAEIAAIVARAPEAVDLPWQFAAATLAAAAAPAVGVSLGGVAHAIVEPGAPGSNAAAIRALFVAHEARRQGWGRRLVAAVAAAYPDRKLIVSANCPEDLAPGFWGSTGFERTALTQLEMLAELAPHAGNEPVAREST